jgi:hypothetical protein
LTVMVSLGVGWWCDHRGQAAAVAYYREANEYWRESARSVDDMLTAGFGFTIKREGASKSYIPPPSLSLDPAWPTP